MKYCVKIGLYRCSQDGALVLVLEDTDECGGTRITGHKPVRLDLIETFRCEFTDADLADAALAREERNHGK